MKKQLLILFLFAFTFVNAQQIQNSDFEGPDLPANCNGGEEHVNEAQPARTKVMQDDGSWYRCGGTSIEVDGAEGNVLVSVSSKTPSIRQTISNQVTVGEAIAAGTWYRVKVRLKNRGAHVNNENNVTISFRHLNDVNVVVPGVALISGEDSTLSVVDNVLLIPYDSFDNTEYSTFEFAFQTPSTLPVGADVNGNGTTANTGSATYHEGVVIQMTRPKVSSSSNAADDIFIAEVSMLEDTTASVKELKQFNFSFAPNPTKNILRLSAVNKIESVELFNLLGQKILQKELNSNNETIDISGLDRGVYVMNVTIDGSKGSFKIIKE
tara:strand:+ start:26425 stop:27396 length:972 start_codon:yes stop_codon:yes gene_type:complete